MGARQIVDIGRDANVARGLLHPRSCPILLLKLSNYSYPQVMELQVHDISIRGAHGDDSCTDGR
jgi:hypothetical protein